MDKLLLKFVYLFRRFLEKQGVDFSRMITIVETKLLMDKRRVHMNWRQQQQKKENSNHFTNVLLLYGFFGVFIGVLVASLPSFQLSMIIVHAYVLFMMAMTLITDFSTVLLDTADNQIILPTPVSSKTLFMARLLHILLYLLQFTIALTAIPVVVVVFKYGPLVGIAMTITVVLSALLAVFFTYLLYMLLLRFSNEEKVKEVVTYFQIFMTVFFTLGYQVLPRLMNAKELSAGFELHWYSYLLPPVWMALTLDALHTQQLDAIHTCMIALAISSPVVSCWLLNTYLAPSFARKLAAMQAGDGGKPYAAVSKKQRRPVSAILSRLFCPGSLERGAFEATWKITSRDKAFRLQFYPALALILVFIFVFVFKSGRNISESWQQLPDSNSFLWFIYLPLFTMAGSIVLVAFNENYQASWIYHSMPVARPGELVSGSIKLLFVKYFIPAYALMFAFACYVWGSHVADDFLFGFLNNALCYLVFANLSEHYLPFSRQPSTKQQAGRMIIMTFQFIIVSLLVLIHYFIIIWPMVMYSAVPLLAFICWQLIKALQTLPWRKISI